MVNKAIALLSYCCAAMVLRLMMLHMLQMCSERGAYCMYSTVINWPR